MIWHHLTDGEKHKFRVIMETFKLYMSCQTFRRKYINSKYSTEEAELPRDDGKVALQDEDTIVWIYYDPKGSNPLSYLVRSNVLVQLYQNMHVSLNNFRITINFSLIFTLILIFYCLE